VIGSTITPFFAALDLLDLAGLVFGRKVLVDKPKPPLLRRAMASADSVTVSIGRREERNVQLDARVSGCGYRRSDGTKSE